MSIFARNSSLYPGYLVIITERRVIANCFQPWRILVTRVNHHSWTETGELCAIVAAISDIVLQGRTCREGVE